MLFKKIVIYSGFIERGNHYEKMFLFETALSRPPTGFMDPFRGPRSAD